MSLDKEVHVIENGTYEGNVSACVTVIDRYLNKLKDAGVYDNSVIIIMSDHGYNADGGTEGRQNPFLLLRAEEKKRHLKFQTIHFLMRIFLLYITIFLRESRHLKFSF